MPYRGDDLDLRTPQGWGAGTGQPGSEPNWATRTTIYKGGRADPIWVDDNVMACCNHAFDLAIAHRAPEVRLEHLINAMTLNDEIALQLESRGIGVAQLRRESGLILASEAPTGAVNGKLQPKRSEAMEEALRLAADRAYPRRTPVTIDDILHVLFDMKRDLPGLQLLRRYSAPWSGRNGAEARPEGRHDTMPPLSRPSYPAEPRYVASEEPRQRYQPASSQDYYAQPPVQPPMPPRVPREREGVNAQVDVLQNNRLDALDRAVRDLSLDLADDRKSLQSIVGELQRQTSSQADDTTRFRGGLSERLAALEDAVIRARTEPASVPPAIFDRIAGMERLMDARMSELGRSQQLPAGLIDRLGAIERTIEQRLSELGRSQQLPVAFTDRMAGLERSLDQRLSEIGRSWGAFADRVAALEIAVKRPTDVTMPAMLSARLDTMDTLQQKIESLEQTFSVILDRLTGIERQTGTQQAKPVDLAPIQTRLGELERNVVARVAQSIDLGPVAELLSGIETRVAGLEQAIENRSAETGRTVSFIGERLRSFEEAIGGQKTGDRLGQIERSLTAYAERTVETGNAHERDLSELHEALVKLNTNQQTLAGSLEQWRLDGTGDLSVLGNRLQAVEDVTLRRDDTMELLATQIAAIHNVVAKREVHKSRFRNWLFGTDEWFSASYDTERWRARQAVEVLRELEGRPQLQPRAMPIAPVSAANGVRRA